MDRFSWNRIHSLCSDSLLYYWFILSFRFFSFKSLLLLSVSVPCVCHMYIWRGQNRNSFGNFFWTDFFRWIICIIHDEYDGFRFFSRPVISVITCHNLLLTEITYFHTYVWRSDGSFSQQLNIRFNNTRHQTS